MKSYYFLILGFILKSEAMAQCNYVNLLPVQTGMTKFQTATKILSDNEIIDFKFSNTTYWVSPFYLKNDSVHKSFAYCEFKNKNCFENNDNKITFNFADDTLFGINITFEYAPEKVADLLNMYKTLVDSFKLKYNYNFKITHTNTSTKEQM